MIYLSLLLYSLLGFYAVFILRTAMGWWNLSTQELPVYTPSTKVSILIAARNEADKIEACLKSITTQNYPLELMEIIVIDDHSEDNTFQIASSFNNVIVVKLNEGLAINSYKKKAISKGIELCSGTLIVTTDADCEMGKNWLKEVVYQHQELGKQFISSPVVYHREENMFQGVQSLEFMYLTTIGAAGIQQKRPFSCNGANLAYAKSLFKKVKGFEGIDHLASGDDELLMHKVYAQDPNLIAFTKSREAIVYTTAKKTLKSLLNQRRRWASKSVKYENKYIVVTVVGIWLFHVLLALLFPISFFSAEILSLFLTLIGFKIILEAVLIYAPATFYKKTGFMAYLPIFVMIYMYYFTCIGILGNMGKYQWKGREVN